MTRAHREIRVVVLVATTLLTAGCAGFQLHDAKKSDVASTIKAQYSATDVLGSIAIQQQNLVALSDEELSAVRENAEIQRDFALLEIVDNDSPMAVTWVEGIQSGIAKLGFDDVLTLRGYTRKTDIFLNVRSRELDRLASRIKDAAGVTVPPCDVDFSNTSEVEWPSGLEETALALAKTRYERYASVCQQAIGTTDSGALALARAEWVKAKAALEAKAAEVGAAKDRVKQAKEHHKSAVAAAEAAGKKGDKLRSAAKDSADSLLSSLNQAALLAPSVVTEERIAGISALLQAAASDSINPDESLPGNIAEAVLIVNGVTSLAGDIATLVAQAKSPSIGNLLIEMQHQVAVLEHARALQRLEHERIVILEAKYRAYQAEASEWLAFHDAICSFGVLNSGGEHPTQSCDHFSAVVQEDGTATCSIRDDSAVQCDLSQPWKTHLSNPPGGDAGREFYKSLASQIRLFPIQASQTESNFRLIDLEHRRNLAAREFALRAWNNLAAVPIDQLDAYYASGMKPEEIADFLVKALGLTAIAIGVSE